MERLLVQEGELTGSARQIVAMAKERNIIIKNVSKQRLDLVYPGHQGMVAVLPAHEYADVESIFKKAEEKGEMPLIVVLDGIEDPHNLGAIIRTAEVVGAHGVIIPERRASGLSPAAVKASSGAVLYMPIARVRNITDTLEDLKKRGVWIFGAEMEGEPYQKQDYKVPLALVLGAEGAGLSSRVKNALDKMVSIPVRGQIDSLNVSVAAGVLLYQILMGRT